MTDVYVVRNQLGQFWGKSKVWVDGRDPRAIMRTSHEDEAMNTLFELSSKDIELRGEVVHVPLSERKDPVVEASEHLIEPESKPEPAPETEAEPTAAMEDGQASDTAEPEADTAAEPSTT